MKALVVNKISGIGYRGDVVSSSDVGVSLTNVELIDPGEQDRQLPSGLLDWKAMKVHTRVVPASTVVVVPLGIVLHVFYEGDET